MRITDRITAAAMTLAFMAWVRPDPDPTVWGVALVVMLMYEGLAYCIGQVREIRKQQRIAVNIRARQEDAERWEKQRFG